MLTLTIHAIRPEVYFNKNNERSHEIFLKQIKS